MFSRIWVSTVGLCGPRARFCSRAVVVDSFALPEKDAIAPLRVFMYTDISVRYPLGGVRVRFRVRFQAVNQDHGKGGVEFKGGSRHD